jgi:hypothetical protein
VRRLGSDSFEQREAAGAALDRLGEAALPALRQALRSDDPEVRRRAGEVEARLRARWRDELAAAMKALGGDSGVLDRGDGTPPDQWLLFPSQAGDADVARVARLPGAAAVGGIVLDRTRVTDACLPHLARFPGLLHLWLSRTAVTGRGLSGLGGLGLSTLHLEGTAIRDRGLAELVRLTSLRRVSLSSTAITDNGLGELRALPRLSYLDLENTAVTDRGVEKFRGMPGLLLELKGTKVSAALAEEFERPFACTLPGSRP